MIGHGVFYVYRYLYIGYHVLVSDTSTPYVNLKFVGHTDELEVHTLSSGKRMYHTVILSGYSIASPAYDLPKEHATPYDYIMSGEIDDKIKYTRTMVNKIVIDRGFLTSEKRQVESDYIENLAIRFHDVSDDVRRKLGLRKRE